MKIHLAYVANPNIALYEESNRASKLVENLNNLSNHIRRSNQAIIYLWTNQKTIGINSSLTPHPFNNLTHNPKVKIRYLDDQNTVVGKYLDEINKRHTNYSDGLFNLNLAHFVDYQTIAMAFILFNYGGISFNERTLNIISQLMPQEHVIDLSRVKSYLNEEAIAFSLDNSFKAIVSMPRNSDLLDINKNLTNNVIKANHICIFQDDTNDSDDEGSYSDSDSSHSIEEINNTILKLEREELHDCDIYSLSSTSQEDITTHYSIAQDLTLLGLMMDRKKLPSVLLNMQDSDLSVEFLKILNQHRQRNPNIGGIDTMKKLINTPLTNGTLKITQNNPQTFDKFIHEIFGINAQKFRQAINS